MSQKKGGLVFWAHPEGVQMASNKKVEENRLPLKFYSTYWEGFSALYTALFFSSNIIYIILIDNLI